MVGPLALLLVMVTKHASRGKGGGGGEAWQKHYFVGDLPSEWDTSAVNLTNDLLSKATKDFDRKSLGVGVCIQLWACSVEYR